MIKIIYIYILILFFNCASQGMPQGGPVDIDGPVFLGVYPNNKKDIKGYDTNVLEFDERINPNSILNSISGFFNLTFLSSLLQISSPTIALNSGEVWGNDLFCLFVNILNV